MQARTRVRLGKDSRGRRSVTTAKVEAISDDRIANNIVRHEYRILSEEEKLQMKAVKDLGAEFILNCDQIGRSADLTVAKRKMQEAVFWAVYHITSDK